MIHARTVEEMRPTTVRYICYECDRCHRKIELPEPPKDMYQCPDGWCRLIAGSMDMMICAFCYTSLQQWVQR